MFKCSLCNFFSNEIKTYNKHLYGHRNERNASFQCVFANCFQCFKNYDSFRSHLNRKHFAEKAVLLGSAKCVIKCKVPLCVYESPFLKYIIKHTCHDHLKVNEQIICPISFCTKKFHVASTFRSHVFRKHSSYYENQENSYENISHEYLHLRNRDFSNENSSDRAIFTCHESRNSENNIDEVEIIKKTIPLMLLKFKSQFCIPETIIQDIVSEFKSVQSCNILLAKQKIEKICSVYKIASKIKEELIVEISRNLDIINHCFYSLDSSYKRVKYFHDSSSFIEPKEIYLGRKNNHTDCTYHYVSILKSLEILLNDKKIQDLFINRISLQSSRNYVENYTDGYVYKRNNFFEAHEKRIEIILYLDSFEICNPLSSSKSKHSLLGVYYALGNLPVHNRYKIDNIQLILLCKEKFVKLFGIDKVLEYLLIELKDLEDVGINLQIDANNILVKGSVVVALADNLGSHLVGGFIENFSASKYFCRFCLYTREDLIKCDIMPKVRRTNEDYINAVQSVAAIPEKKHIRGVKFESPLNRLSHYKICSFGLPACIAHDLFEGIVKVDLWEIIMVFINKGIVSFSFLNMKYKAVSKTLKKKLSLPDLHKKQKRLPGTAYENMQFLILFPIVMYSLEFNREMNEWRLIIRLLEICRIALSVKIYSDQIDYFSYIIQDYFLLMRCCFPQKKLLPKHHYLAHYPELIRAQGPLKHLWTMQFEHKHQFFKTAMKKMKNCKNVTKMLTECHQMYQSFLSNSRIPAEIYTSSVEDLVPNMFENINTSNLKFVTKNIEIRGVHYKEGDCVMVNKDEYEYIYALEIFNIFLSENFLNPTFYGKQIQLYYNYQSGLYESINEEKIYQIVPFEKLLVPDCLNLYATKNKKIFSTQCWL